MADVTERRFPVAGTELMIPWEVAEALWKEYQRTVNSEWARQRTFEQAAVEAKIDELHPKTLDRLYGPHWREVAE